MKVQMINRATDMEAVSRIFNHPKVYEWISDDSAIPPYIPDPSHFYVMNEEKTGVARIDQLNGITCIIHIATLPEMWGRATTFVKEGIVWLFKNTRYLKIVSLAPECNRAAIMFGKRCGFKIEGKITKSFLKDWVLHDQIIFGLSKYDKEALCQ